MKYLINLLFLVIVTETFSQTNVKINEKAPQINITNWIENVPNNRNFEGKFIVLEFWATWCGPCIAAVPHMNELQKKFNQSDLYYISITDESVEKVQRLLKRVSFNSIVVTDLTKQTQIDYGDGKKGLKTYPLTILIDNKGIIKWIGEPKELTDEIMLKFLGTNIAKNNKSENQLITTTNNVNSLDFIKLIKDKELNYYFNLIESQSSESSKQSMGNNIFSFESYALKDIFLDVFKVNNIEIPSNLSEKRFDLLYKNTNKEESLAKLEKELLKKLDLEKHTEVRITSIYSISIQNKTLLEETLEEKYSSKSYADNKLILTAYTITNTLEELSKLSTKQFKFKENNTLKYDFIINIDSDNAIISSLQSYGLKTEESKADLEYIELKQK